MKRAILAITLIVSAAALAITMRPATPPPAVTLDFERRFPPLVQPPGYGEDWAKELQPQPAPQPSHFPAWRGKERIKI